MPSVVPFTCCLIIVFTTFIDDSNGKWKSKNRENLQKDIAKFQEMAVKIEDEIEDIYDEYSDSWMNNEYVTNEEDSLEPENVYNSNNNTNKLNQINLISNSTNNITGGDMTSMPKSVISENVTPKNINMNEIRSPKKTNIVSSKWPKFEDMLLDMGKKYDWKNDRWIKVKKKSNQSNESNLTFHERHKFSYKTVKLNRSKSRRNVVIAVMAVR